MSLSDPYNDAREGAVGPVPGGSCDGFTAKTAGTVSFTTLKGTAITAFPVVAGQLVPWRIKSIEGLDGGATVLLGYHTPLA